MKTDTFWQGLACVALVAALAVVVVHITSAPPVKAGGGAAGGVIAVTAAESGLHRLYLIDTTRKVILVYGGRTEYEFSMLAGRYFDVDAQATVGNEWKFNQRGYPIVVMNNELKKKQRKK